MTRDLHLDFLRVYFDFVHNDLDLIKHHILELDDEESEKLFHVLEQDAMLTIVRLRLHLGVPYTKAEGNGPELSGPDRE